MLVPAIRCMSLLIVSLDVTIVNIALPSIQRDPHAPVSRLQWATDAYRLVLASALMLSRSTRDRADPVHPGLAAVHPGAGPWLAGRLPDAASGWRVGAQPGDRPTHIRLPTAS
jgi:MFS family permease